MGNTSTLLLPFARMMVTKHLHLPAERRLFRSACRAALPAVLLLGLAGRGFGQTPPVHYWNQASAAPGVIGAGQLQRGGPLPGYFQPVRILGPADLQVAMAGPAGFDEAQPAPANVALLVGAVYRLRVMNIPSHPGQELFPTIEMIDRLYTPQGQQRRFAIPIEITQEDMELALSGRFVLRVIYLEQPDYALPARTTPQSPGWFDVGPGRDPLAVADALGRPVAILRMGGRVPDENELRSAGFYFGCPPAMLLPPMPVTPVAAAAATASPAAPEAEKTAPPAPEKPAAPAEGRPKP
jgi:hypothetical protein